ncbi:LysE family transporter, partial [Cohnella suwonensis]
DPIHGGSFAFIILGLTFTFTGGVWCILVALFSSFATNKLRNNSKIATVLNKITGIVFIGMGLNLLRAKATR